MSASEYPGEYNRNFRYVPCWIECLGDIRHQEIITIAFDQNYYGRIIGILSFRFWFYVRLMKRFVKVCGAAVHTASSPLNDAFNN